MTDESVQTYDTNEETRRQATLRRATRWAAGLVAGSILVSKTSSADARTVACCGLSNTPNCATNDNGSIICPSGTHLASWYCCYSGRTWRCSECLTGSGCRGGGYQCSLAVRLSSAC